MTPIEGVFGTPTSYGAVSQLFGAPYGSFVASVGGSSGSIGVPCSPGSKLQFVRPLPIIFENKAYRHAGTVRR